jgi:hypothetical protein
MGGKSSALADGLKSATPPIIVCVCCQSQFSDKEYISPEKKDCPDGDFGSLLEEGVDSIDEEKKSDSLTCPEEK